MPGEPRRYRISERNWKMRSGRDFYWFYVYRGWRREVRTNFAWLKSRCWYRPIRIYFRPKKAEGGTSYQYLPLLMNVYRLTGKKTLVIPVSIVDLWQLEYVFRIPPVTPQWVWISWQDRWVVHKFLPGGAWSALDVVEAEKEVACLKINTPCVLKLWKGNSEPSPLLR